MNRTRGILVWRLIILFFLHYNLLHVTYKNRESKNSASFLWSHDTIRFWYIGKQAVFFFCFFLQRIVLWAKFFIKGPEGINKCWFTRTEAQESDRCHSKRQLRRNFIHTHLHTLLYDGSRDSLVDKSATIALWPTQEISVNNADI